MRNAHPGQLDQLRTPPFADEKDQELLTQDADTLRNFYALTGPARKEYLELLAEADAARIRKAAEAHAEGILALRRAEAEGYKAIGQALAETSNPAMVLEIARLQTLQRVAQALADGKATKLFLPTGLDGLLGLLGAGKEVLGSVGGEKPAEESGKTEV